MLERVLAHDPRIGNARGFPQCQGGFRVKILRFGRLGRNFKALWVGFAQLLFEASTRGREGLGLNFMASG